MPVKENEFWKEGMDGKRFALCMKNKIWFILAAALAGALFGGAVYMTARGITMGEPQYRAEVLYFIGYDIQEEDDTLKEFINEYNAYTWGDMMKSDRVILPVMEAVPDAEREVIEASITTDIASDPEFLTACFTTENEELSNRIAVAYNGSMAAFGQTMRGRGLTGIEVWKTTPAKKVEPENRVVRAAALGAVLGLLAGALALAGRYVLDDSIMLSSDFEKKYPYPVFGYRTQKPEERWERPLDAHLTCLAKKGAFREIPLSKAAAQDADFDYLREAPILLLVEWGTPCGRLLGYVMENLKLEDIEVLGIIITEADNRFLRRYYGQPLKGTGEQI